MYNLKNRELKRICERFNKEKNKQWREENPEKVFNQNTKRRFKEENQGRGQKIHLKLKI